MKVLVVGGGGREAATVKALRADPNVSVTAVPGNEGMRGLAELVPSKADDIPGIRALAKDVGFDLVFVGPEAPLVKGLVDALRADGTKCVGPTMQAAMRTEGSKAMCQKWCQQAGVAIVPGAWFSEEVKALEFIDAHPEMLVVKADGLAAGKGVVVGKNQSEARRAVTQALVKKKFGPAGQTVVIQKKLVGREISFHVLVGKDGYKILPGVQDYKLAPNGLNSGGLGAKRSDVPDDILTQFRRDILEPTLASITYEGILFAGCMLSEGKLWLLEYNCRFGDPELQVLTAVMKTPFIEVIQALAEQSVSKLKLKFSDDRAVVVVGCTAGYPGEIPESALRKPITGLERILRDPDQNAYVLPAGVGINRDRNHVNTGGRVLNFVGRGGSDKEAAKQAYGMSKEVYFDGMWTLPGIGTSI